jgi:hypothetical protein
MDDYDQYDSASQYGQGLDDTASMISGYTVRTQKTATTGITFEEQVDKLTISTDPIFAISSVRNNENESFGDGVIELEANDDVSAELPPHACRRVPSDVSAHQQF